jgi:hypothetical protein
MKHDYPTTRKPRDVLYSKTHHLIQRVGEERLKGLLSRHGMYNAAKILSNELLTEISPYVVRHARSKLNDRTETDVESRDALSKND